jgi:uncharacterized protein YutD
MKKIEKMIEINNVQYEIVRDEGDCINREELMEKITDYFDPYDYILGDFAYEKVRLKGYYESTNKKATDINNIKNVDNYIKDYCSFGAKYFLLKKIK